MAFPYQNYGGYGTDWTFQEGIDAPMLLGVDEDEQRQRQLFDYLRGIQGQARSAGYQEQNKGRIFGGANEIGAQMPDIPGTGQRAPLFPIGGVAPAQMPEYLQANPSARHQADLIGQRPGQQPIPQANIPPATQPASTTAPPANGSGGQQRSRADVNALYDMVLQRILGMNPYQFQPTSLPELGIHAFLNQGRY
jgi:hypothetical protein